MASPLPPHVSASRRTCSTPQVLVPGAGAVPASSCLGELLEVMLHMFRVFRSLPSCIPQHCSFTKPCQGRRQQGGPVPGSPTPLHLQAEACHAPLPGPTIACWGNTAGGLIPKPGFHVECGCRQGKCNFGGRHGRNNAAGWRLRGCRAQNLQLLVGSRAGPRGISRDTEQKPEDAAITGGIGGFRGRLCPQPEKM